MTREESIRYLNTIKPYVGDNIKESIDMAIKALEQEPKTGTWEWLPLEGNSELGNWFCSECDFSPAPYDFEKRHFNYCPNCGAKMVEPQESEEKE